MAHIGLKQLDPILTGSLQVSGSAGVTGSLSVTSNIGALGDISASGTIFAEQLTTSDDLLVEDQARIKTALINPDAVSTGDFRVKSENLNHVLYTDANKDRVGIAWNNPAGSELLSSLHIDGDATLTHITASGNVSASGTVYASNFESAGSAGELISFNDNLNITGYITASGDINTTAGRVYEAGTSVIDHATAMAIVFGG